MTPVSHGYYAVEGRSPAAEGDDEVVVQREQVEDNEWWFYGVLHARIGAGVTEYLQDNLFNNNLNQVIKYNFFFLVGNYHIIY